MKIEHKNILLIGGFVLMLLIGYFAAFSETISVYSNYKMLSKQEAISTSMPQRRYALEKKKHYYDSLLTYYRISDTSLQNNLLATIERFAKDENLTIINFEKPHISKENDRTIQSYQFVVSGEYQAILNLAYQFEQRNKFGMISSFEIVKATARRAKKAHLEGRFLLQLVK